MNVYLANELSRLVHNECKGVPHDIGIRLIRIVEKHEEAINYTHCCEKLKDRNYNISYLARVFIRNVEKKYLISVYQKMKGYIVAFIN